MNPVVYFKTLLDTLVNTKSYPIIVRQPLTFSGLFFTISMIWLGLLMGTVFNYYELPQFTQTAHSAINQVIERYPADLVMTWNGQHLSVNSEPVVIQYPDSFPTQDFQLPSVFSVVKPSASDANQAIQDTAISSLTVVTSQSLYVSDLNGGWTSTTLDTLPGFQTPFTLTKATIPGFAQYWRETVDSMRNVAQYASLVTFPLYLIFSRLWRVLFDSVLIAIWAKLSNWPIKFATIFQIGLHVAVWAQIAEQIADVIYPTLTFPLFTLVFWSMMGLIFLTQLPYLRPSKQS